MTLTIAAAGAAVMAILEITLWPYLGFLGASPHPVLIGTVLWGGLGRFEAALAWAFTGGLMLDILAPRPLGTTSLVLLVVVALAVAAGRALSQVRARAIAPVLAIVPLSLLYSFGVALLVAGVDGTAVPRNPLPVLIPSAVVDGVIVAAVVAAIVVLRARRPEPERVGW